MWMPTLFLTCSLHPWACGLFLMPKIPGHHSSGELTLIFQDLAHSPTLCRPMQRASLDEARTQLPSTHAQCCCLPSIPLSLRYRTCLVLPAQETLSSFRTSYSSLFHVLCEHLLHIQPDFVCLDRARDQWAGPGAVAHACM